MRSNAYKIKVKVFSVKQKANQIPLTTIEKKSNFVPSRKQPYVPSDYKL